MMKDTEEETKKPIDLDFEEVYRPEDRVKIVERINLEENMDAKDIIQILEPYLKDLGLLTVREKNYVGFNESPFDLTAGDEDALAIYGFEIKSDKDTFDRLERQLQHYSYVCENIFLVVHKKEVPSWLPSWCGVIRVSSDKKIYQESYSYKNDLFNISTGYAWDRIASENGIAGSKDKLQKLFNEIMGIRKNILFNHYFAIEYDKATNNSTFKKFFPLSDRQKSFITGLTIEYQIKEFQRELKTMERRFETIKQSVNVQLNIKEKEKNGKIKC